MSKGEVTTGPNSEAAATTVKRKGLRGGALGLLSGVVVGLASMAPAYSLAATLGLIVASGGGQLSGVKAPAVVLISFIPPDVPYRADLSPFHRVLFPNLFPIRRS